MLPGFGVSFLREGLVQGNIAEACIIEYAHTKLEDTVLCGSARNHNDVGTKQSQCGGEP